MTINRPFKLPWLDSCYDESKLPTETFIKFCDELKKTYVKNIKSMCSLDDDLYKYIIKKHTPEFEKNYFGVEEDAIVDVTLENVANSVISNAIFKTTSDLKSLNTLEMKDLLHGIIEKGVNRHLNQISYTFEYQLSTTTDSISSNKLLNILNFKNIESINDAENIEKTQIGILSDALGRSIVGLLKQNKVDMYKICLFLKNLPLSPSLRMYLWSNGIFNAENLIKSDNFKNKSSNYDKKQYRKTFHNNIERGIRQLDIVNAVKSPIDSLISKNIKNIYFNERSTLYNRSTDEFVKDLLRILNIIYTATNKFEANFIYVLYPLILAYQNISKEQGFYYEMAMLSSLFMSYVFPQTDNILSITDRTMQQLNLIDQELYNYLFDGEKYEKLNLSDKKTTQQLTSCKTIQRNVVNWINRLYCTILTNQQVLFCWDQLFLNFWSLNSFVNINLTILLIIKDILICNTTIDESIIFQLMKSSKLSHFIQMYKNVQKEKYACDETIYILKIPLFTLSHFSIDLSFDELNQDEKVILNEIMKMKLFQMELILCHLQNINENSSENVEGLRSFDYNYENEYFYQKIDGIYFDVTEKMVDRKNENKNDDINKDGESNDKNKNDEKDEKNESTVCYNLKLHSMKTYALFDAIEKKVKTKENLSENLVVYVIFTAEISKIDNVDKLKIYESNEKLNYLFNKDECMARVYLGSFIIHPFNIEEGKDNDLDDCLHIIRPKISIGFCNDNFDDFVKINVQHSIYRELISHIISSFKIEKSFYISDTPGTDKPTTAIESDSSIDEGEEIENNVNLKLNKIEILPEGAILIAIKITQIKNHVIKDEKIVLCDLSSNARYPSIISDKIRLKEKSDKDCSIRVFVYALSYPKLTLELLGECELVLFKNNSLLNDGRYYVPIYQNLQSGKSSNKQDKNDQIKYPTTYLYYSVYKEEYPLESELTEDYSALFDQQKNANELEKKYLKEIYDPNKKKFNFHVQEMVQYAYALKNKKDILEKECKSFYKQLFEKSLLHKDLPLMEISKIISYKQKYGIFTRVVDAFNLPDQHFPSCYCHINKTENRNNLNHFVSQNLIFESFKRWPKWNDMDSVLHINKAVSDAVLLIQFFNVKHVYKPTAEHKSPGILVPDKLQIRKSNFSCWSAVSLIDSNFVNDGIYILPLFAGQPSKEILSKINSNNIESLLKSEYDDGNKLKSTVTISIRNAFFETFDEINVDFKSRNEKIIKRIISEVDYKNITTLKPTGQKIYEYVVRNLNDQTKRLGPTGKIYNIEKDYYISLMNHIFQEYLHNIAKKLIIMKLVSNVIYLKLKTLKLEEFPIGNKNSKWRSGKKFICNDVTKFSTEELVNYLTDEKSIWNEKKNWSNDFRNIRIQYTVNNTKYDILQLTYLKLNNEEITKIDKTLTIFKNLQTLVLSANYLENINCKNIPKTLKSLELCANRLEFIEEFIPKEIPKLQYLGLSWNRFESILKFLNPPEWQHLYFLDLSYNNITDLYNTVKIIGEIDKLRMLCLMGNPISLISEYRIYIIDYLNKLSYLDENEIKLDEKHKCRTTSKRLELNTSTVRINMMFSNFENIDIENNQIVSKPNAETPMVEYKYYIELDLPNNYNDEKPISEYSFATPSTDLKPENESLISQQSAKSIKSTNASRNRSQGRSKYKTPSKSNDKANIPKIDFFIIENDDGYILRTKMLSLTDFNEKKFVNQIKTNNILPIRNWFKNIVNVKICRQSIVYTQLQKRNSSPVNAKKVDPKNDLTKKQKKKKNDDFEMQISEPIYETLANYKINLSSLLDGKTKHHESTPSQQNEMDPKTATSKEEPKDKKLNIKKKNNKANMTSMDASVETMTYETNFNLNIDLILWQSTLEALRYLKLENQL
ncbi:hypothetical protein A3Q56_02606 [Intoshia linei]|uniref:Uncharacterized protein n=1 Tax=Intoshia linei TaxID=1819745 RepID=A0A177B7H6_9BILA|nr:hypothetical protein A3Q56_02606 [Intoshia linei]